MKQNLIVMIAVLGINLSYSQQKSITLTDLSLDEESPAAFKELQIPSNGAMLQGFIYLANGSEPHPTLFMLHGYPGNERNLDIAQLVRAEGWNVVYFNYRGSWGSEGTFSFKNCVQDVVNVVDYIKDNNEEYKADPDNMVLFGHSMGGWTCLKAIQEIPSIKKGFAISAWDIAGTFKNLDTSKQSVVEFVKSWNGDYFVLNAPVADIFDPVLESIDDYDLSKDGKKLSEKNIVMIDEHQQNEHIAKALEKANKASFNYDVWNTDHSFTNKRVSLALALISFLKD